MSPRALTDDKAAIRLTVTWRPPEGMKSMRPTIANAPRWFCKRAVNVMPQASRASATFTVTLARTELPSTVRPNTGCCGHTGRTVRCIDHRVEVDLPLTSSSVAVSNSCRLHPETARKAG